jgi:hypothetical protein
MTSIGTQLNLVPGPYLLGALGERPVAPLYGSALGSASTQWQRLCGIELDIISIDWKHMMNFIFFSIFEHHSTGSSSSLGLLVIPLQVVAAPSGRASGGWRVHGRVRR